MRFAAILAAVVLGLTAARAAAPEQGYFAARDKAIAQIKKLAAAGADAKAQAVEKAALADLTKRLVALVGPVAVKGFAATAKPNLETLGDNPGNGVIDGLAFDTVPAREDGSKLIVTTKPLFAAWAKARAADAASTQTLPETPEEALKSEVFYTYGVAEDAAFSRAAEVEIEKPAGADFAVALLGRWSQDIGPSPLDRLEVAVVKGARILVADVETANKPAETPACKAIWDAASAKADKFNDAYRKGGAKDDKLFEQSTKAQEQGSQDWLACEGKAVKAGPGYPALKSEAQDLAARLSGG